MRKLVACAAALATIAMCVAVPAVSSARQFELGIYDGPAFSSESRETWLNRTRGAGASIALMGVAWSTVAPQNVPTGFDASNPGDPRYNWGGVDAFVRAAAAAGLRPVLAVTRAPRWAEGPGRPAGAPAGTWRPDPRALEDFSRAIATRYSGTFVDIAAGSQALPRVSYFQAWTEPNLSGHLTPQWKGKRARSPVIYRELLNAVYRGVNDVSPGAKVLTAGTAPYGDAPGGDRVRPLKFWRDTFCLRRKGLAPKACPTKARFDILAHHPINTSGPPHRSALHPDDISTPDLPALQRVSRAASRARTVVPRTRKPLWVTEFWWLSRPATRDGLSQAKQARYISDSLYLFWKAGADAAVNLRIRDGKRGEDHAGSGLYTASGRPKPALKAFTFPFVVTGDGRRKRVWGLATQGKSVQLQAKRNEEWRTIKRMRLRKDFTYTARVPAGFAKSALRAQQGTNTSLVR